MIELTDIREKTLKPLVHPSAIILMVRLPQTGEPSPTEEHTEVHLISGEVIQVAETPDRIKTLVRNFT